MISRRISHRRDRSACSFQSSAASFGARRNAPGYELAQEIPKPVIENVTMLTHDEAVDPDDGEGSLPRAVSPELKRTIRRGVEGRRQESGITGASGTVANSGWTQRVCDLVPLPAQADALGPEILPIPGCDQVAKGAGDPERAADDSVTLRREDQDDRRSVFWQATG